MQWHPDKNPGDEKATTNFQKISEAFATLSDPKKRKIYDQYGADAANQADQMGDDMPHGGMPFGFRPGGGGHQSNMSPEDAEKIFSAFFGGGDPFGGSFGAGGRKMHFTSSGGGRPGSGRVQADPFAQMFGGGMGGMGMPGGMPGMSFGGMPGGGMPGAMGGSFASARQERRYDAIPSGTIVSLKGLVSQPERNGDRGEVQQYDSRSGRYIVIIEDTDETMKVKPENLLQHVHVKLHGLESKPDWNGQRGTVIAWDESKERYNIYVMGLKRAVALKPANVVLDNDTVGKITGLQSKPELNGKYGTIKNFDRNSGRYDVQLSKDKILRLKLENIHL